MWEFSAGDWLFIGLILLLIHGIMLILSRMRGRKEASGS